MNQNQSDRLDHLRRTWRKSGPNALRPSEKDELINLLIKQHEESAASISTTPVDDVDEYGPEGGSARAMHKLE